MKGAIAFGSTRARLAVAVGVTLLLALGVMALQASPAFASGTVTVSVQGKGDVSGTGVNCNESGGTDCSEFYADTTYEECDPERKPPCITFTESPTVEFTAGLDRSGYVYDGLERLRHGYRSDLRTHGVHEHGGDRALPGRAGSQRFIPQPQLGRTARQDHPQRQRERQLRDCFARRVPRPRRLQGDRQHGAVREPRVRHRPRGRRVGGGPGDGLRRGGQQLLHHVHHHDRQHRPHPEHHKRP